MQIWKSLSRALMPVAIALVGLTGGALHAQTPAVAPAAATVSLADGYVLGTGDVVEVSVLGREEFRPRVQVQTDGTIQLPYLNSIPAANRTVLKLREEIRQALKDGGYYANPVVAVNVATFASRYVTVLGEVGTPGLVPVDRAYRVSEILARVGGARESGSDTLALRRATGEEITLNIRKIATGGEADDPIVNPGDKLFIAAAETFYIYGQVTAPGTYRVDHDMNLLKALARGGGLTSLGSEKRVKVIRAGVEITRFKPTDTIKGGDVVVIGERFF